MLRRFSASLLVLGLGSLAACATTPPPVAATAPVPPASPPAKALEPVATEPYLQVRVAPRFEPSPLVHVEVELLPPVAVQEFRLLHGAPEGLKGLTLADAGGAVGTKLAADGGGTVLSAERALAGVIRLTYDVVASGNLVEDPLGERIAGANFRGSGEATFLLPAALDDQALPIDLVLDGRALYARKAATSLGIGDVHRSKGTPNRLLRHLALLVGALGGAVFDGSEGHDEAAWSGAPAFDPRSVAAEVAVTHSEVIARLHAEEEATPSTLLIATEARPIGDYATTPRAGGVLLELGASQPWTAALRVSVTQQLLRRWFSTLFQVEPGHEAERYWFTEGVARFYATRLLASLGLVRPDEFRDALVGELSVGLLAPSAHETNVALASRAATEQAARAQLVARGALYAARVNALIRERSRGQGSIDALILDLLTAARQAKQPLPLAAWNDGLTRYAGPGEASNFQKMIEQGGTVDLPKETLGHCYRRSTGPYVAFDLGFDGAATRQAGTGPVVGLAPKGPAARAGLKTGDVVVNADYHEGDPEARVTLDVERGGKKLSLKYEPKGERRLGPSWTRVPGIPDEKCSDAW